MKNNRKNSGLSLMETVVVIAIVAGLASLSLPAVKTFFSSLATSGSGKATIAAALAHARAIAAKEQRYAGIRFQKEYTGDTLKDILNAEQYMIFIINDEPRNMGNLTVGFRAVEGTEPIKLPENTGVMDMRLGSSSPGQIISDNSFIDEAWEITDTTAFSVIFSPAGNMVIHDVRVRNRNGRTEGTETINISSDDIFNTYTKINNPVNPHGKFLQDDYQIDGLFKEPSRNSFIIYDKIEFRKALEKGEPYTGYLEKLSLDKPVYINAYTGRMISTGQ